MSVAYILRLDDIAPNMHWEHYFRTKEVCLRLGIKPLLGVIPDNRDPKLLANPLCTFDFTEEILSVQADGWQIAQHGYQHRYVTANGGMLNLSRQSEFAGLPLNEQRDKLARGREILQAQGIETRVFMAPAHSFDRNTLRALVDSGFEAVTDGLSLYPFREHGLLFVPQLFATPRSMPFGVYSTCLHLNAMNGPALDRVVSFLERHAQEFISFEAAERFERSRLLAKASGRVVHSALQLGRRVRRMTRSGDSTD